MLGAELGPQPADVDVDRAGAAEVVVAPDLLQQLGAREHAAGVLGDELEQLELLVREVERPAGDPCGVGRLVDDQVTGADLVRHVVRRRSRRREPAQRQPQPRLDLGRAGGVEEDVVDSPVGRDGREPALGHDGHQRDVDAGRADESGQPARVAEITPGVDQDGVADGCVEQRRRLAREPP